MRPRLNIEEKCRWGKVHVLLSSVNDSLRLSRLLCTMSQATEGSISLSPLLTASAAAARKHDHIMFSSADWV